ncbi:MAG: peptide-methionine (S)-S-oxide reductase MsrA [Muribaculaceae bacterium]|nr:peptide-methionine (S)-S-oxide reductase MsrA [Muribaculaceae bacterium]
MNREIYFAGGCFWGVEHFFKQVNGVVETCVGYANGKTENPTYKDVCTDTTGYAETVRVCYDPQVVSLGLLLDLYFMAIDPVSVNRQGEDTGTQYRTGIYYTDRQDVPAIEEKFRQEEKEIGASLAVEVLPLENFHNAEDYHQDYLDKNPGGYCHLPLELFRYARNANRKS